MSWYKKSAASVYLIHASVINDRSLEASINTKRTITGIVTDESDNPVANTSVMIKETWVGVGTNFPGFEIF